MRFDYFFSLPLSVDLVLFYFFFPVLCLKISFWCFETQPECPSKITNNFSMPFLKPLLLDLALGDNKD